MQKHAHTHRHWDLFCEVVDNYGDAGVCWRLARGLARAGAIVRLWIDDPALIAWMAPGGEPGVEVIDASDPAIVRSAVAARAPDVLVEAFGCDPAPELVARFAADVAASGRARPWINLEYLSAEPYVERLHTLPSPVFRGPGAGLTKHFFYPGFTPATGGLLREPDLAARRAAFDRAGWLAAHGIGWRGEPVVTLFCYEPRALPALLSAWAGGAEPIRLLVTAGRAARAVRAALPALGVGPSPVQTEIDPAPMPTADVATATEVVAGRLALTFLPLLTQTAFDELLWAGDVNFVRGEDSLVRAIWAGAPFAWQIYPQDDDAHHVKLDALLDAIAAPASLRRFHAAWNEVDDVPIAWPDAATRSEWAVAARAARRRLAAQDDLVAQLLRFAETDRDA
jgi:uncharacterized repeat protein (TIGR03837 family)